MISGICSAGVPSPSSSPARRLRLPSARIVAVRSPTPASPAKVSCSAPRGARVGDALAPDLRRRDAGGVHALRLGGGARPGRRRSWRRRRPPPRSCPRSARRRGPPRRRRCRAGRGGRRRGCPSTSAAVPETASLACAGPPREAIARARIRSETYSEGSAAIGATIPLLSSRTEARWPTRSPIAPTACGSAAEGTARQTRSMPASSMSRGALDGEGIGQRNAREVVLVGPASRSSPPPAPGCGCRAGPRVRRERAGRRRRCPSSRRRSRRPCGAAAGRRATPTAARSPARCGRRPSSRGPATGPRCGGR